MLTIHVPDYYAHVVTLMPDNQYCMSNLLMLPTFLISTTLLKINKHKLKYKITSKQNSTKNALLYMSFLHTSCRHLGPPPPTPCSALPAIVL